MVKRNRERFPEDFMFRLTVAEKAEVITKCDHLHRAWGHHDGHGVEQPPRSGNERVGRPRAFVRLRGMLATNKALADNLAELERKVASHDEHIQSLFDAIRQLMAPPELRPKRIGFRFEEAGPPYRTRRLHRAHPQLASPPVGGEG